MSSDDDDTFLDDALADFVALQSATPTSPAPTQAPRFTPSPAPSSASTSGEAPPIPPQTSKEEIERFAETMKNFAATAEEFEKEMGKDGENEDMMEKLMGQFEENGAYRDVDMVDSMMKQLVSKDMLYEPLKEMHEKYPGWLSANKAKLPSEEYQNYVKQFGYIEQIMFLYDKNGDDSFQEVMRLMKEMQDCGQVPPEIVQELAPGVEFAQDGLPKFPGQGEGDQCTIS